MGSLAWVEPTGVTHWIDDSFTHPTWAYMHLNPGFDRDDFIRLNDETIDAQDALLKSGWLRVSSMNSIEMEDPDTLDQRAWDTWSEIAAPCAGKFGYEPESMIMIGYGLEELGYMKVPMADVVETYCSKRAQDKFWSMVMGESLVRRLVRSVLRENLQSFLSKTVNTSYIADSEADPTFEWYPEQRKVAKELKRIWAQEADHKFMDSVTKIHWMSKPSRASIMTLMNGSKKDEISTMGYLSSVGTFRNDGWGTVGFRIEGRTTIAANNMDELYTGYFEKASAQDRMSKYKSSGIPKRPSQYAQDRQGQYYILDEASFNPKGIGYNEFVVDNWRVTGVVLTENTYSTLSEVLSTSSPQKWVTRDENYKPMSEKWTEILSTIAEFKIPYMKRKQANLAKEWLNAASQISP